MTKIRQTEDTNRAVRDQRQSEHKHSDGDLVGGPVPPSPR